MLLWITFAAITAPVLAALLWPLLRTERQSGPATSGDIAIYRDQLAEIEADAARGVIGEAEAEAARIEISRRLLAAAEKAKDAAEPSGPSHGGLTVASAIGAAVAIPAMSLAFYLAVGSPGLPDQPLASRLETPDAAQEIAVLVGKVEARLREHPGDGRGWDVIAPVYFKMQRYADAAEAYGNALRLEGETVRRLVGYGESLVLADNGIVGEKARLAFEKALKADEGIAKARFWLGVAAEQDGDYGRALDTWREMLADAPEDAPWRGMVRERLQAAESRLAGDGEAESGPSREQMAAARQMSEDERAAMINRMVEGLAQRLAEDGGDLQGWLRLARAYTVLGERGKARDALESARANFRNDDAALAQLAAFQESLGL